VQTAFLKEQSGKDMITFSAGVSENPLDGVEAVQLFEKARELLKKAKSNGKNQVAIV
jgi:PleD family two-component response regulator